jgi:hypothetical protein
MQNDCHAFVSKITQSGKRVPPDARHNIADFVCGVATMSQDILEKFPFELQDVQLLWPAVQGWKITETFVSHVPYMQAVMELEFRTDRASIDFLWGKVYRLMTVHADGSRHTVYGMGRDREFLDAMADGRIKGLFFVVHSTSRRIPTLKEAYEATMANEAAAEARAAATRAAVVEAKATNAACEIVAARAVMASSHLQFKAALERRVTSREVCYREIWAQKEITHRTSLAAYTARRELREAEHTAGYAAIRADEDAAAAEEAARLYGMATTRAAAAEAAAEEAQDEAEEAAQLYWMAMDSQ